MTIDATALIFYAIVCGGLAALAPSAGGRTVRLVVGAIVGIVAAALLPMVRGITGL